MNFGGSHYGNHRFNKTWNNGSAKETAEIIASTAGISVHLFDDRIREINCGQIEGMTEEERVQKWGHRWHNNDLGMEKFEDVADRGSRFMEEIISDYRSKKVLVVSHGALIGLSLQRLLPHLFPTTYIHNASLTILTKENDQWVCNLYNSTDHLD